MIRIRCMQLALASLFSIGLAGAEAAEPQVNIYNWYDFIAPDAMKNFQAQTGIRSTFDVFDNGDVMQGKLMAGRSNYDVVVASGDVMPNLIKAGAQGAGSHAATQLVAPGPRNPRQGTKKRPGQSLRCAVPVGHHRVGL